MKIFNLKTFIKWLVIFTAINLITFFATTDKNLPLKYQAKFLSIEYFIGNLMVSFLMAIIPAAVIQMPSLQPNKLLTKIIRTTLVILVYLFYFFAIV